MFSRVQVEPNSIAARDGRIKEGDRILQVPIFISVTKMHSLQVIVLTPTCLGLSISIHPKLEGVNLSYQPHIYK